MPYAIQTSQSSDSSILNDSASVIYGDSGIGKTTICRQMPKPLFLIMRGGGEHRPMPLLETTIPFIEVDNQQQLYEILFDLRDNKIPDIETVVFDQLTSMYDIFMLHILRNVSRKRDNPETPTQQDYGQARRSFANLIVNCNQIPNLHKVYLALAEIDEDETTREKYGAPMIPGKLAREVLRYMDFVFRMAIRREVVANKLVERRVFSTQPEGIWLAKDSSGKLPTHIPLEGPNYPFWTKIIVPILVETLNRTKANLITVLSSQGRSEAEIATALKGL